MANLDQALATQLANIEKRSGKTLAQLSKIIINSGLAKHGERVAMLKATFNMGHGDANAMVHYAAKTEQGHADAQGSNAVADAPAAGPELVLDGLYTGAKAALRGIHDQLLIEMQKFGAFEAAPKKTYVSYRRNKQFAMIGPATNTRCDLGLNVKGLQANARLQALPAGQMCNFKVKLSGVNEIDQELLVLIKAA